MIEEKARRVVLSVKRAAGGGTGKRNAAKGGTSDGGMRREMMSPQGMANLMTADWLCMGYMNG